VSKVKLFKLYLFSYSEKRKLKRQRSKICKILCRQHEFIKKNPRQPDRPQTGLFHDCISEQTCFSNYIIPRNLGLKRTPTPCHLVWKIPWERKFQCRLCNVWKWEVWLVRNYYIGMYVYHKKYFQFSVFCTCTQENVRSCFSN
jgi:hypothetical protein